MEDIVSFKLVRTSSIGKREKEHQRFKELAFPSPEDALLPEEIGSHLKGLKIGMSRRERKLTEDGNVVTWILPLRRINGPRRIAFAKRSR